MVTKAELEAEIVELRRQLAERRQPEISLVDAQKETADESEHDWQTELTNTLTMIEDFPHKNPMMVALGAFAIGYLLGRTR